MKKHFLICSVITLIGCKNPEQSGAGNFLERISGDYYPKCDGGFYSDGEDITKEQVRYSILTRYIEDYVNRKTTLNQNGSDYQNEIFSEVIGEFTNSNLENIITLDVDKELKNCQCQARVITTPLFRDLIDQYNLSKDIVKNGYVILPLFGEKFKEKGIVINYRLQTDSEGKVLFEVSE